MQVLIVESAAQLAHLWKRHLVHHGMSVTLTDTSSDAIMHINHIPFDIILLDLVLPDGGALTVADYAQYRLPAASVIVVTETTFFSDGSIFSVCPNARALLQTHTPPEDLAIMVQHYGTAA